MNPGLNAIVTLDATGARRAAAAADAALAAGEPVGPLHGVPVTIKDLAAVAGMRTTLGFRLTADWVPTEDATAVARLRAAGAIILGKTNVPELGLDWQTASPIFGRSNNPWATDRTPGGSSGGSAAAVAAGLSALDLGSDAAGSIRVPAAFCGVYGLKPTEHLVSTRGHAEVPDVPRAVRHITVVGPIARSVEDLELALRLIAGPDGAQAEVPPLPLVPAAPRPLAERRFLVSETIGFPVSDDVRAAVRGLAGALALGGARVEDATPPLGTITELIGLWGEIFGAELSAALPPGVRFVFRTALLARLGRDRWTLGFRRGLGAGLPQFARALSARDRAIAAIDRFLGDADGWLLPVASTVAFPHQKVGKPITVAGERLSYALACGVHAAPFSATGHPAVALPVARSAEGLPVGVQLVGRRWEDMALLGAAKQVAEVTVGFTPPPID